MALHCFQNQGMIWLLRNSRSFDLSKNNIRAVFSVKKTLYGNHGEPFFTKWKFHSRKNNGIFLSAKSTLNLQQVFKMSCLWWCLLRKTPFVKVYIIIPTMISQTRHLVITMIGVPLIFVLSIFYIFIVLLILLTHSLTP